MAQNPIVIYSYVLEDGLTPLTWWQSTWNGSAWTAATKFLDTGLPATLTYGISAGQTQDGTHLGVCISHSASPPDVTTLEFLGDGLPATPVDVSNGNTLSIPWFGVSTGAFWYNSAYYNVAVDSVAIRIFTSVTGGAGTWTEVDAAHHPLFGVLVSGTILGQGRNAFRRTGTKIDVFCLQTGFPTQIFLYTFDLSTLTWTGPYAAFLLLGTSAGVVIGDEVVRFSNNNIAGIYHNATTNKTVYRIWNGASWGSEIVMPITGPAQLYSQAIVDPATPNTMHVWLQDNSGGVHASVFSYFTANSSGTISAILYTTRSMDVFSGGGFGHGAGINGILYVPITDPSLTTESVWIGAEGGGSFTETQLPVPPPDVGVTPNGVPYMIDFLSVPLALACPPSSLTVGVPYSNSLVVTGGTGPFTFSIISGALPPGLSLNTSTGVISGTPLFAGNYSYTAQVTDATLATATASCSFSAPLVAGNPCQTANVGPPKPNTDVFFELRRVYATMKPAPRIPTRGS